MTTYLPPPDPTTMPEGPASLGGMYILDVTAEEGAAEAKRNPLTADQLLQIMIARREVYGSPIPEGFVPPPGIDMDELLKRLPPERKRPPAG